MTFSTPPPPNAFCSAWSPASSPDLFDPGVLVQGTQPTSGNDTITVTDSADCSGGFHFGTIDLGQRGYFSSVTTFGGNSGNCKTGNTSGCGKIHWNGQNTLTITLGLFNGTQPPVQPTPSVAVYIPDPALGLSGTISSVMEENF